MLRVHFEYVSLVRKNKAFELRAFAEVEEKPKFYAGGTKVVQQLCFVNILDTPDGFDCS